MVRRVVDGTYRTAKYIVLVVLLLLAAYVSLGRYYLPKLTNYQHWIVQEVADKTGLKITLLGLGGTWEGFSPAVAVDGFKLFGSDTRSDDVVISVGRMTAQLAGLASLKAGQPIFDSITLSNIDLSIEQRADGSWGLAGFAANQQPEKGRSYGLASLRQLANEFDFFYIKDSRVTFKTHDGKVIELDGISVDIRRDKELIKAQLQIQVTPGQVPVSLAFESSAQFDSDDFSAVANLSLDKIDVARFEPIAPEFIPRSLVLSGKISASYSSTSGLILNSQVALNNVDISNIVDKPAHVLDELSGNFSFAYSPEGEWKLYAKNTHINIDTSLYVERFILYKNSQASLGGSLSSLDLAKAGHHLIKSGVLSEGQETLLKTLNPRGRIQRLHWAFDSDKPLAERLQLQAQVDDVCVDPWDSVPGAQHISGYVQSGLFAGYIDLDNSPLQLSFPTVYSQPFDLNKVKGRVAWHVGDRVTVNSSPLSVEAGFGQASVQLDLDLATQEQDSASTMSLLVSLEGSDARYKDQLMPFTLPSDLLSWINQSVKGGEVPKGGFIYYGDFDEGYGRSIQLALDVEQVELQYHEDWPAAKNLDGRLYVDNVDTRARVSRATIMGAKVGPVKVSVLNKNDQLDLSVRGNVAADSATVVKVFQDTPLADMTGNAFKHWQAEGAATAAIDFNMPLLAEATPYVDVIANLDGTWLNMADINIEVDDVNGRIHYNTRHGLTSSGLTAALWKRPVSLAIDTDNLVEGGSKQQNFVISGNGLVDMSDLARWTNQPALWFLSGTTPYKMKLVLAPGENRLQHSMLEIESELDGVSTDLPAPYHKQAQQRWPLKMVMPLTTDQQRISFSLAERGQLKLALEQGELVQGQLILGSKWRDLGDSKAFVVSGDVAEFSVSPWLDQLARYQKLLAEQAPAQMDKNSREVELPFVVDGLHIGQASMFGTLLNDVTASVKLVDKRWQINLDSEKLTGIVKLPSSGEQIDIDIKHMDYPFVVAAQKNTAPGLEGKERADTVDPLGNFSPLELPPMKVNIASLHYNSADFGQWSFHSKPYENGVLVEDIVASFKALTLGPFEEKNTANNKKTNTKKVVHTTTLNWQVDNGVHHTTFDGVIQARDLAAVTKALGYDKIITSKTASFDTHLTWQGSPASVAVERLDGRITMNIKDGQFVETGSARSLKIFGVFNVSNLSRRLRLDFSDLYKKGLSYDVVKGTIHFDKGYLRITQPLLIDGPSTDFKFSGLFDVENKQVDGQLVVTLPITEHIPWIAALVGAVPTGGASVAAAAGAYFAGGKYFKAQLDSLSSVVYSIKGPLSEPEVKFEKVFDRNKGNKKASD